MNQKNQEDLIIPNSGCLHINGSYISFIMRQNNRIKGQRLVISPEEGLVIESKKNITLIKAKNLIITKQEWVLKTLNQIHKKREKKNHIKKQNNSLLVFGEEKQILLKTKQITSYIYETSNTLYIGTTKERFSMTEAHEKTTNWLINKAKNYIPKRVTLLSKNKFNVTGISIKNQKSIWGSCSSSKKLNFSYRLIMAPQYASDYIIIHELCHTRHLNHSKAYWELVKKHCPDYKKSEKWFKDYGFVLHEESL